MCAGVSVGVSSGSTSRRVGRQDEEKAKEEWKQGLSTRYLGILSSLISPACGMQAKLGIPRRLETRELETSGEGQRSRADWGVDWTASTHKATYLGTQVEALTAHST